MHTYDLLIREFHLDTFGHVNNATYLQLFEEARWEMITSRGYGLPQVQSFKKGPVVLGCSLKFKKELRLRERITIESTCDDPRLKVSIIRQKMINGIGEVACEAEFQFGLMDLQARKLVPPTPEWLHALGVE